MRAGKLPFVCVIPGACPLAMVDRPRKATHTVDFNVRLAFDQDIDHVVMAEMRLRLARMIEAEVTKSMGLSPLTHAGTIVHFEVGPASYRWVEGEHGETIVLDDLAPRVMQDSEIEEEMAPSISP